MSILALSSIKGQTTTPKCTGVVLRLMMNGGGKVPYPKHVWSPAGGWYGQPHNWKANTAFCGLVIVGLTGILWKISAEREVRVKMPEPGRFFPSRYWSRQIIEYEKVQKEKGEST